MLEDLASEDYAYLTTTGRRTAAPHEIEIWFATDGGRIWMISGGRDRSDWVRNLLAVPTARVRIGSETFTVVARPALVDPTERRAAAEALHAKYAGQVSATAEQWVADAYLVGFDPV
jgi:deazaflavin-dependent oxidoreductase (nitroreductase family)